MHRLGSIQRSAGIKAARIIMALALCAAGVSSQETAEKPPAYQRAMGRPEILPQR